MVEGLTSLGYFHSVERTRLEQVIGIAVGGNFAGPGLSNNAFQFSTRQGEPGKGPVDQGQFIISSGTII